MNLNSKNTQKASAVNFVATSKYSFVFLTTHAFWFLYIKIFADSNFVQYYTCHIIFQEFAALY